MNGDLKRIFDSVAEVISEDGKEIWRLREENKRLREALQDVDACYAVNGYLAQAVVEKVSAALAPNALVGPHGEGPKE